MSRKYKFQNQEKLYFISFGVVYWIDVFIRDEYKDLLLKSWDYCMEEKGLEVWAWVIMPSHVHMIIGTEGEAMQNILRDMKRHTSTKLKELIQTYPQESRKEWMLWMMERAGKKYSHNKGFQFWQQHNNPMELNTNVMMQQKLDYIHENPVKAGFVSEPHHWLYCSALDYSGGKRLLRGIKLIT